MTRFTLIGIGDKLLTLVLINLAFKGTNLLQINRCRLKKRAMSLADITIGDDIGFMKNIHDFRAIHEDSNYH